MCVHVAWKVNVNFTAPKDVTSEDDDEMLIGPPISLAQSAAATTAHVSQ